MKHGNCHCKESSYQYDPGDAFMFVCQCSSCRKLSSGGRLLGMSVSQQNFSSKGPIRVYEYTGGSGSPIQLSFCSKCSTQLFALPTHYEEMVVIRAATIESFDEFLPKKVLHCLDAPDWDVQSLPIQDN